MDKDYDYVVLLSEVQILPLLSLPDLMFSLHSMFPIIPISAIVFSLLLYDVVASHFQIIHVLHLQSLPVPSLVFLLAFRSPASLILCDPEACGVHDHVITK